jgi:diacylglycerol O-acyltransferase
MTIEPEYLSREDASILALEAGTIRGHTCKVIHLADARWGTELGRLLDARITPGSRLRLRLADCEPAAWEPDPEFDAQRHVRDLGSVSADALPAAIAELMSAQLPRDRPLWAIDVLGVEGGGTALVWRLHHALADGTTAMEMAREVLVDGAEPERAARAAPPASRLRALRETAAIPGALARELLRRGGTSPLDHRAGERRVVGFTEVPLETVRTIAHVAPGRATVNDVVLAAVAGGIRAWLRVTGGSAEALRVKVPVSLHAAGAGANRDSFIVADLPLDEEDPKQSLAEIASQTRDRKRRHDAESLDRFFRDLAHLSRSLERHAEAWARSPSVFTLNVSNVIGPGGDLSVLGSRVTAFYSLAEIAHRHALRIAVVSASGRLGFGLCADATTMPDLVPVTQGIKQELLDLA